MPKKIKNIKKLIRKKKFSLIIWLILIILGLVLGGLGIHSALKEKEEIKEPFNLESLKEVQVKVVPNIIFLVEKEKGCQVLPIYISLEQSVFIAGGLTTISRPLTHDLIKNVLEGLEIELVRVEIIDLQEGAYYANLVLRKGKEIIKIDSRPSDAIAVALRMTKPVYVKEELFSQGTNICRQEYQGESWVEEIREVL